MASTTTYMEIQSRLLGIPVPTITTYTQRLREDESIFRRGKRGMGSVEPTASEISSLLIALCATPSTGRAAPHPLDVVRTARAAVRVTDNAPHINSDAIKELSVARASTFGDAIEALIADMCSGTYATWKGDSYPHAVIRFYDHGGRIFINLQRHGDPMSVLMFRNENGNFGGPCLNQIAELDLFALEELAKAMAPIAGPSNSTRERRK